MRPRFQKRHYHEIASAIRKTRALPHDSAQEAMTDLVEELIGRLAADNPRFRAETFRQEASR